MFYLVKGLFRKALLCLKGTDMFAESLNVVVIPAFLWTADFVPPLLAFFFFFLDLHLKLSLPQGYEANLHPLLIIV